MTLPTDGIVNDGPRRLQSGDQDEEDSEQDLHARDQGPGDAVPVSLEDGCANVVHFKR